MKVLPVSVVGIDPTSFHTANGEFYLNTRKLLLSADNPYWCIGKAANGLGGPHVGVDMFGPVHAITPLFPRLRSGHRLFQRPSPKAIS
jgi:meiotically up-regulated gene 157 (Mug157) protein